MTNFTLHRHTLILIVVLTALSGFTVAATDYSVGANTACTLADAIRAANQDAAKGNCPAGQGTDSITLTSDITLAEKLPVVWSALRINGNGHTISAGTRHRILKVAEGGNLELRSLRLHQGYTSRAPGAALYVQHGNVQLTDVKITDNLNESGFGGAVGIDSGSFNCLGCTFESNLGVTGGALWVGANAYATINNSRFEDNSAQKGGAIYVEGGGLLFHSSKAYGNDAGYGGVIFSDSASIQLRSFSDVSGNYASGHGGGLYAKGGHVVVSDTRMRDNQASLGRDIYADADLYMLWPNDMSRDGIYHVR